MLINSIPSPEGDEANVPPEIWNTPSFQQWLTSQKAAGNRLDGFEPYLVFKVGLAKNIVFFWAGHVNIWVESEQRHKSNELVIGRPDIMHVVAFHKPDGAHLLDTQILLVREFRSTSTTADGFIREVPGGSGAKGERQEDHASREFWEETSIEIGVDRLLPLGARQVASTTATHRAHVFSVVLTRGKMDTTRKMRQAGNEGEFERTYPEVYLFRDLLREPVTDWSNLGMITAALLATER